MEMSENNTPAKKSYDGSGNFSVSAGKSVELSHWDSGKITDLDMECPEGKQWEVIVQMSIHETDA